MNPSQKPFAPRPALDRLFGTRPATIHVRTVLTAALFAGAFFVRGRYDLRDLLCMTGIAVGLTIVPSRANLERVYGERLVAKANRLLVWGFLGLFAFGTLLPSVILVLSVVFSNDTPPAIDFLCLLVASIWFGVWFWFARAVHRYGKSSVR